MSNIHSSQPIKSIQVPLVLIKNVVKLCILLQKTWFSLLFLQDPVVSTFWWTRIHPPYKNVTFVNRRALFFSNSLTRFNWFLMTTSFILYSTFFHIDFVALFLVGWFTNLFWNIFTSRFLEKFAVQIRFGLSKFFVHNRVTR